MSSSTSSLPLVDRAFRHGDRPAIVEGSTTYTYADLERRSGSLANALLAGRDDLREARVAYLISPSFDHVAVQWAIWRAGGIGVPLCLAHPPRELEYSIADSRASLVVVEEVLADRVRPIVDSRPSVQMVVIEHVAELESILDLHERARLSLPEISLERRAMILYTSGTTSRPKGVVHTHRSIAAQIEMLVRAWEWRSTDRILSVLPLHHVHGVINIVSCALWSGAMCEMCPRFDGTEVLRRLASEEVTVFMAVPTIYARLLEGVKAAERSAVDQLARATKAMRLMVSGSAALPTSLFQHWRQVSGHDLLERYGMTEIGMALSNPLHGERRPGFVGRPLPGVEIRLVDDSGRVTAQGPGEIRVRGEAVFREYWKRPEATAESFDEDWFRTGDVAVVEDGSYRILGRQNIDIIKTGGYKVSALEIEEVLREHPKIVECAVVGLADEEWGERVAVGVVVDQGVDLDLDELRLWARDLLAPYKLPTHLRTMSALPRNVLGKVTKPALAKTLAESL